MNKLTLITLLLLVSSMAWASSENDGTDETIVLTEAGTLREKVMELESNRIRSIKVSGPFNGADMAYLNSGAGRVANLQSIDLVGIQLVADSVVYATYEIQNPVGLGTLVYKYALGGNGFGSEGDDFPSLGGNSSAIIYNDHLACAFINMKNLRSVVLPSSLRRIGDCTFYNCENLAKVDIPNSVKSVGSKAFFMSGIASVSLGNITEMADSAFCRCENLSGEIDLSSLSNIPGFAFYQCHGITNVIWSKNLKSIGRFAFSKTSLTKLHIPEGCTSIGSSAFEYTQINEITLPESAIDVCSFSNTPWLESEYKKNEPLIYLGKVFMGINQYYDFSSMTEATIREGTVAIANGQMFGNKFRKVTLPESLRWIGGYNFSYNTNLEEINLPANLEHIGEYAFEKCKLLQDVSFGQKLSSIGAFAFFECQNLSKLELPSSIEFLGESAFNGCSGVVKLRYDLPRTNKINIFHRCSGLEVAILGPNVREIPMYFFRQCTNLTNIDFEEMPEMKLNAPQMASAQTEQSLIIKEYAFSDNTSLTTITLPTYLKEIGKDAFNSKSLKTVKCYLSEPIDISKSKLNINGKNTTIYVDSNVLPIFLSDSDWSKCNLIGVETSGISTPLVDSSNVPAYNLSGRPVSYGYKGIVIKDGKKFIKR